MAFYVDEAQVWKCPKHPSRRRRSGICPKCLRERLVTLCPDCATALPCSCCSDPADTSSSSISSSSSSVSLFSFSRGGSRRDFGPSSEAGRLPNDFEANPALRKSKSVALSFLGLRSKHSGGYNGELVAENNKSLPPKVSRSKINLWSVFNKSKKCDVHGDGMNEDQSNKNDDLATVDDYSTMMRSRSVAVGTGDGFVPAAPKPKGWYFPSPVKAFRHSKVSKSVAVS